MGWEKKDFDKVKDDSANSAAQKKAEAEQALIKRSVNEVLKTEAGRVVFKYMAKITGFHDAGIALNPQTGLIDTASTACNAVRRIPYALFRRMAEPELLIPIELPSKEEEEVGEEKI